MVLTALAVLPAWSSSTWARQGEVNDDPAAVKLVTSDIDNFWRAYDQVQAGAKARKTFHKAYLAKGSPGLKDFLRLRIDTVGDLVRVIEAHPRYYRQLRHSTDRLDTITEHVRRSFHRLRELYPKAVFPDVYFLVGKMTTGGTTSDAGLLIGVEMFGLSDEPAMEEFGSWHRQVLRSVDHLPRIVAHELIHYQQNYTQPTKTLLAQSIQEGSADFVAELVVGAHINAHLHEYGDRRERQLWDEFQPRMRGTDYSGWLYDGESAEGRPADLGYYMGYKIAAAYYRQAADKSQALHDILNIDDFDAFLAASGYAGRLDHQAGPSLTPGGPQRRE